LKILYVEDNDDNIYMLERRLKRAGFDVLIARDGAEGVAMATAELPALILMDMGLPVLDGSEATRRIKAAPETKHIPVIALTANAMTGDREKALAAGCDDFDTKPVDLTRLLGKIQALAPGGAACAPPGRPKTRSAPPWGTAPRCQPQAGGSSSESGGGRVARRRRQRGQSVHAHA